ncbi:hypothetical protein JIG36_27545 [Actinoplanes sp. LDG1-06]|uniref:Lipoprotein n=1 Tax=Paractinoplanes ovalisporus TaxID=2810368 RepID=A0ABS2AJB2_9ACTN|nr:hypothetical protein [Actinoplanes ovalisporus]MBM2619311.1 hypothetical protein [Actinoplanes ovalisporus]
MQRARRLVSIVVVASLATAGLTACRSEPSVAAYVGDSAKVTEARVQDVWDNAEEALTAATADQPEAPAMSITRADIVRTLVGHDVLTGVARREGVTLPAELALGDYATQLRLPQSAEYVRLYAEFDGLLRALRTKVQSSAPDATDDDLREVYDVLLSSGEIPAGTTFDQFKQQLPAENLALVKTAAAVRKEVAELTDTMEITVNPRYQPLNIPVLEFQTQSGQLSPLVVVPLGEGADSPVTDVS